MKNRVGAGQCHTAADNGDTWAMYLLGLSYRLDTRDDRIAPTSGRVDGASLDGAGLGGFSKFLRLEGRASFFAQPPGWFPRWVPGLSISPRSIVDYLFGLTT